MPRKQLNLFKEEDGTILMSKANIKLINEQEGLYDFPELNNKLYLHFKGFKKIENLEEYVNVATIWLENNGLKTIENLGHMTQLHTLFLHNNCIFRMENLESLQNLRVLNLQHNYIEKIDNLGELKLLQSLDISHNNLSTAQGIEGIIQCQSITNFDLSDNKFDYDEDIFNIFPKMLNLACLYLRNTQYLRQCPQYRRRMVFNNQKLKFLDERPVTAEERRINDAWGRDGREGENEERKKIGEEKKQDTQRYLDGLKKTQQDQKEKRQRMFDKAKQEASEEIGMLQLLYLEKQNQGECQAHLNVILRDIENLNEKIENLTFDTVRTEPKIRTQCFSVTRKDDGEVKVWNREEEEINFIKEEFFNKDAVEMSKTENERLQEYQAMKDKQPQKLQVVTKPIEHINEEDIENIEQIPGYGQSEEDLEWENEFDEYLCMLFQYYKEPSVVTIEFNQCVQGILIRMEKKLKVNFTEDYLTEKHNAILHRKSVITNKDYEKMLQSTTKIQLEDLD